MRPSSNAACPMCDAWIVAAAPLLVCIWLSLPQQEEDGLLHFTWRERTAAGPSGDPAVNVMFVPGAEQITFKAVGCLGCAAARQADPVPYVGFLSVGL